MSISASATKVTIRPLDSETRHTLPTREAARHLSRAEQTLRHWASGAKGGPITPLRINGVLAWPVAALKKELGLVP